MAIPHNSRLTAQAPLRQLRHGICVAKMLDNVGLRYPHRASGAKAPRTLRPLPLLRFTVSATGGAHLCSIQHYLRFWLSICRTSLAVSALRIMRYCPKTLLALCACKTVTSYFCGTGIMLVIPVVPHRYQYAAFTDPRREQCTPPAAAKAPCCARGLFLVPAAALCYNTGIFLQRHCPLPVEH